jgi:hypothetical protein
MEAIEKTRYFFGRNAHAAISNSEFRCRPNVSQANGDFFFEGKLESVRDKVKHDLLPLVRTTKKAELSVKNKEPLEISVASVHDVEGACLWHDLVQDVHIVHIPTGDADERGNVAVLVQQSMHLDGGLALTKLRPRE